MKEKKPDGLQKQKIDAIVSAKVFSPDLDTLKEHNVNISKLIRRALSEAAKRYR